MTLQTIAVNPVDGNTPSSQLGVAIKNGGLITLDAQLPAYFKMLHVGGGGDLLVRGIDNNIIPFLGLVSGQFVPVIGYEVVSAATVDGQALTTTCTDITWHGGQ
jgi:hypothetical protein